MTQNQRVTDNQVLASNGLAVVRLLASQRPRELLSAFIDQLLQNLARNHTDSHGSSDAPGIESQRRQYLYAYSKLKAGRALLTQNFFDYLNTTLEHFVANRLEAGEAAFQTDSSLTLMDGDQLEEQALITALRQRADSRYQELLWPLQKRLALLVDGTSSALNPLSPLHFCLALRHGLNQAGIAHAVKQVIYNWFGSLFLCRLEDFYQQLNTGLEAVGINPDTRFDIVKAGDNSVEVPEPAVETPVSVIEPTVPEELPAPDVHSEGALLQQISQLLSGGNQLQLRAADREIIATVGSVLQEVVDNRQLSDEIKALMSLLHMPLLKVALSDWHFFQQVGHPARQLVNQLAKTAVAPVVDDDGRSDVYRHIRSTVERLLRNTNVHVRHFAEELLLLRAFIKQQQLKARRRAADTSAKNDLLRLQGQVELDRRIAGRSLPRVIVTFLQQYWRDYLVSLALELGDNRDSDNHWNDAVSAIDDLLWGLQVDPLSKECSRWRHHYLWLEATLVKGLEGIGVETGLQRKLLSDIRRVYEPLLAGRRPANAAVQPLAVRVSSKMTEQDCLQQLQDIPCGSWFQFASGRREQLVWRNLRTMQFQFSEQVGRKSVMRTGRDMARLMAEGAVCLEMADTEALPASGQSLKQLP